MLALVRPVVPMFTGDVAGRKLDGYVEKLWTKASVVVFFPGRFYH